MATMRSVLIVLAAVAIAEASKAVPFLKYHEDVGIPTLERIRRYERSLDFDGSRIAGGTVVEAGAQPHLAGIIISLSDGYTSLCSGSLLTNTHSLTAAHCWDDGWRQAVSFELVFGSSSLLEGGVRVTTSRVAVHDDWNTINFNNDIAVVMHDWIQYSNVINRILLPSGPELDQNFVGAYAEAAGFGLTQTGPPAEYPDKRQATLQVITNGLCEQIFGSAMVVASTLCTSGAEGANVCNGDTGGPLSVGTSNNRILIGVASFTSMECNAGLPAAFTRVTSFWAWIVTSISYNAQI